MTYLEAPNRKIVLGEHTPRAPYNVYPNKQKKYITQKPGSDTCQPNFQHALQFTIFAMHVQNALVPVYVRNYEMQNPFL